MADSKKDPKPADEGGRAADRDSAGSIYKKDTESSHDAAFLEITPEEQREGEK